jgi:AcrR family transcriptional regulator
VSVQSPRDRLLEGAIDYVAANGITDLSLRRLATALGTSHRMLIHHFGSKEGLWVAIVREVEHRQRAILAEMVPAVADQPVEQAMRAWWRHISDPSLWPNERLFYELYGQAIQGRPHTVEMLDGIIEDWLEPAVAINLALGLSAEAARAHARLGIAVTRGLLLDLVATRDVDGVNRAMEAFIEIYAGWLRNR